MKPKAVIVDDERHARENLSMLLQEYCPELEVAGMAGSVQDALVLIPEVSPDVLFLDIRMPSGTEGFDLLDSLPQKNFQVIFVTAFKEYAVHAFRANAMHYLLKPVDIGELRAAVGKVMERHCLIRASSAEMSGYMQSLQRISQTFRNQHPVQRIPINHAGGTKIVEDRNIIRLEADGNCTTLHFSDGATYLDTRTLKVYENMLNSDLFFRIHKSHIVNLFCVEEYISEGGHAVRMKNGDLLPLARSRVEEFRAKIKKE